MQTRNSGRQASSVPTVGDAETTNVGTAASDGPRQSKRRRLSGAAVEYKIQKEKTPRKSSQGYLTMEAAAAKHGYASKTPRQDVRRKLRQQALRLEKINEAAAAESLRDLINSQDEIHDVDVDRSSGAADGQSQGTSKGRLGNCGRKALSDEERQAQRVDKFTFHGFSDFQAYAKMVSECAEKVHDADIGCKLGVATELVKEKLTHNGKQLMTPKHLCSLARAEEITEIRRRGGVLLTTDEEKHIADEVRKSRMHYLAVRPSHVLRLATKIVQTDVERAQLINESGITKGWFSGFCVRNGIRTGKSHGLDVQRAKWLTSENAMTHYNVLKDVLLEKGVAVLNDDYEPTTEGSSELIMNHAGRLVSLDETSISLCESPTGDNEQRICLVSEQDDGNILVSKGLPSGTLLFTRLGNCDMLAPLIVLNGTGEFPAAWCHEGVRGYAVDSSGELVPTLWRRNEKASVNSALLIEYAQKSLLPALFANGVQPGVPGAGGVLVFDGCSTHVSKEFLSLMAENNVSVVLRPPNTSSVMQGEDTTVFRYFKFVFSFSFWVLFSLFIARHRTFKSKLRVAVQDLLTERQDTSQQHSYVQLTMGDFGECIARAFASIDMKGLIESAWSNDGVIPFDRRIAYELLQQEQQLKEIETQRVFHEPLRAQRSDLPALKVNGVNASFLLPNSTQKSRKSLEKVMSHFKCLDAAKEELDKMIEEQSTRTEQLLQLLQSTMDGVQHIKDAYVEFLNANAPVPRPADLWALKGGANGADALELLERSEEAAAARAQGQGQRGRPVANLDERVAAAHDAFNEILNDLRRHKQLERLNRDQLVTCFLHIFERPPHAGMKKNAMVEALEPEFARNYPEYICENESESEDVVETQDEEDDVDDGREIDLNLLFPSSRVQPIQEPTP